MGKPTARNRYGRTGLRLAAVTALMSLGGCVEQLPEVQGAAGDLRAAHGPLKAATAALVSLEGAPKDVDSAFRQALTSEAAGRRITMTDAAAAHYLVRGYLSAYPGDTGVQVAYTYDVFDAADRHRRQRVSDTIDVPGDADHPWSAVTPAVMASLAGRSADDLATQLADPAAAADQTAAVGETPPGETPPRVN